MLTTLKPMAQRLVHEEGPQSRQKATGAPQSQ
jgi:hypothetical protein